ncbi:hypothetical protein PTTG_27694 [Puccinia triticina 1-1 BBBD Race 1]|uniref:BED-type domain-containing protein n=1 Tax=Puccinia triticina (isolate 1-1 / race 1 (BBBD)) TaxID=630390 RepID=A0A180GIR0_PUCT1|nr:hypothetical protein PTTG_27694 [Puccinia triticina 1-1 BBBD Race 1]
MARTRSQQVRPLKRKKHVPSSTKDDTGATNDAKGSIDQDHQSPAESEAKDNIQVLDPSQPRESQEKAPRSTNKASQTREKSSSQGQKPRKTTSEIWNHFKPSGEGEEKRGQCRYCQKLVRNETPLATPQTMHLLSITKQADYAANLEEFNTGQLGVFSAEVPQSSCKDGRY